MDTNQKAEAPIRKIETRVTKLRKVHFALGDLLRAMEGIISELGSEDIETLDDDIRSTRAKVIELFPEETSLCKRLSALETKVKELGESLAPSPTRPPIALNMAKNDARPLPLWPNISEYLYATSPVLNERNELIGTGFFYASWGQPVPAWSTAPAQCDVFITCKHVFAPLDSELWEDVSSLRDKFHYLTRYAPNGQPTSKVHKRTMDFRWAILPKDRRVDLIAFPVPHAPEEDDWHLTFFGDSLIRNKTDQELPLFHDIGMIGYPKGLWDEENRLPVPRHGTLSFPNHHSWEQGHLGVMSIACYTGDSGAPVFTYHASGVLSLLGVHGDGTEGYVDENLAIGYYTKASELYKMLLGDGGHAPYLQMQGARAEPQASSSSPLPVLQSEVSPEHNLSDIELTSQHAIAEQINEEQRKRRDASLIASSSASSSSPEQN